MGFEPVLGTNRFKWKKKRAMHKPTYEQREIRSAEFPRLKVKNQTWHSRTSADFVDLEYLLFGYSGSLENSQDREDVS